MGSSLTNRRIIVTGGGGRLGSRIVGHFADAGALVSALVVSDEEASRVPVNGSGTAIVKADVTSESSVFEAFREIAGAHGGLDALVHTVGMWTGSPLLDTSQASWDEMIRVNLTSAFLCFREAIRHMDGTGTLVAVSSRQGADAGAGEQASYSAAKAGIVRLVEATAEEYANTGISAHAIAPSTILFDEAGEGVPAADLVSLVGYLVEKGASLSGSTIRAYGTG